MPTTSNFGWTTPADTNLVKDGAAAIRTLGNNIDASLVDLKGGTTGQVLAKASNADLDYTWSNVDPLTILDAKGDLISATAADTPARLASSGVNGDVLTVDTSTSTGLKWATPASGGMTLISSTTLSGSAVTLSSIPGTYKNLAIVVRGMQSATPTWPVFTSTSTTFYGFLTYGNTVTNVNLTSGNIADSNAETIWSFQMLINDYTNSNYKGWSVEGGNNGTTKFVASGMMSKTSAINDLTLTSGAGTFSAGTILLYGVQ